MRKHDKVGRDMTGIQVATHSATNPVGHTDWPAHGDRRWKGEYVALIA